MRILNDPSFKKHYLGLFPEDIPLQAVYEKILLPDLYQLEHGITLRGIKFIGTPFAVLGDHPELCELGGLMSAWCNYHTTLHVSMTYFP